MKSRLVQATLLVLCWPALANPQGINRPTPQLPAPLPEARIVVPLRDVVETLDALGRSRLPFEFEMRMTMRCVSGQCSGFVRPSDDVPGIAESVRTFCTPRCGDLAETYRELCRNTCPPQRTR